MPTPYQIALLLSRMFACMSIAGGLAQIVISVGFLQLFNSGTETGGFGYWLLTYGALELVGGIGILVAAKWIARFASKND